MSPVWKENPHRRFNPLSDEWILVSPQRTDRPWQGEVERVVEPAAPAYDPLCYLCPGNSRAHGARNPNYTSVFAFDNDFPALQPSTPPININDHRLLRAETEPGICRVLCFSPRHDLTIADMDPGDIRTVVNAWRNEFRSLGELSFINHVQIFENRGEMMGASNPHPHCQIWANATVPDRIARETMAQRNYLQRSGSCLLCDYGELERNSERTVLNDGYFLALVPFWAVWPFETMLIPLRHVGSIDELNAAECDAFARILKQITATYNRVFNAPFPYTMGIHQKPVDHAEHPEWHMHVHYYPPLLRSATVRKFMVGYEMLASPQRDVTAESAAEALRNVLA